MHGEQRTHELKWHDPSIGPGAARSMSGIEYLRAMRDGALPAAPVAALMDLQFDAIEPGRLVFRAVAREFFTNPIGIVHGGFAATLLDSAMGCATITVLAAGQTFATLDLHVTFVRGVKAGEELLATGTILHRGNRLITSISRLEDVAGKLYAHATSSCMVLSWPD
ncbi:MAG: aromatic compound degradation protein PaaI [Candidatus Meridianibacter frigidus]|nr:MAG: aromatic compound degradation protein PaaI [Candidatus Eremiobacteraeota bacterium]